jgi:hypothetical protein
MCGPTSKHKNSEEKGTFREAAPEDENKFILRTKIFPISPLLVLSLAPLLPWINRGYTQWFHSVVLAWLLTQSPLLVNFLALQGTSVTLGWYAALINDYCLYGPFGRILYNNMPHCMMQHMVMPSGELVYSQMGMYMMGLSHVLDTLGHPILAYYFVHRHYKDGGNLDSLLTWRVIISTYMLSRIWSLVHTYFNFGDFRLFYFGYDVYKISDLDSWLPAYLAEGTLYLLIVAWKLSPRSEKSVTTYWISNSG